MCFCDIIGKSPEPKIHSIASILNTPKTSKTTFVLDLQKGLFSPRVSIWSFPSFGAKKGDQNYRNHEEDFSKPCVRSSKPCVSMVTNNMSSCLCLLTCLAIVIIRRIFQNLVSDDQNRVPGWLQTMCPHAQNLHRTMWSPWRKSCGQTMRGVSSIPILKP